MFENPRRGRQARNFTTNVPKIVDLKSSSEQIFSENCRWVPLYHIKLDIWTCFVDQCNGQKRDSLTFRVVSKPKMASTFEGEEDVNLKEKLNESFNKLTCNI